MQTEIEVKFLNVDHDEIRAKLRELDAECVSPSRLMRRKNFDYPDGRLDAVNGWVRVRDEADRTTLAYKQLNDRTLHGTKEVSVEVSDFEMTCAFLESIGLEQKAFQETKRESWVLDNVQIELDEWPWAPAYLELEAPTEDELDIMLTRLGLSMSQGVHGSVEVVYADVYDVTDDEINKIDEIKFGPVPDWLKKRLK